MDTELIFRIALGAQVAAFFFVRAYHNRRAVKQGGQIEYREPHAPLMVAMRLFGGVILLSGFGLYWFRPEWVAWASLPVPIWLRWIGMGLGAISVILVWWTEVALGLNFQTVLHVREGHTLVTNGPYRWVRHPMYTALYLMTVAWLLISANAWIGLPGWLSLTAIMINRVKAEEALMVEQFGDQYRQYMSRTPRFLPGLF